MHIETACYDGVSLVENPLSRVKEVIERHQTLQEYALVLLSQGIVPLGDRFYCCMQHDDEALQKTVKAWEYVLSLIPEKDN
jgi:glutamate-1-semialdehyde 2,1-aminomutase